MNTMIRFLICSVLSVTMLYSYVNEQNAVTRLRLQIPKLASEVRALEEENTRLQYQIELFESPENLLRLAALADFAHLKHPTRTQVLYVAQGEPLEMGSKVVAKVPTSIKIPLASGLVP